MTDRRTDRRTDGGDCNFPDAFFKKAWGYLLGSNKDCMGIMHSDVIDTVFDSGDAWDTMP